MQPSLRDDDSNPRSFPALKGRAKFNRRFATKSVAAKAGIILFGRFPALERWATINRPLRGRNITVPTSVTPSTRSVGMNVARRFNAGIQCEPQDLVASATTESNVLIGCNRRYATTTQIHDLSRP